MQHFSRQCILDPCLKLSENLQVVSCFLQNAGKFAAKTNVASIASMSDSLDPVCLFSPKLSTPFLKQESKSVPIVIKKCKHGKDLTDGCK